MPDGFPILRNRKVAISNFFVYFLFMYSNFAAPAFAGVSHGTYFAMYLSEDYLALAIDSRRTEDRPNGAKLIFDKQCKIVPLSNRAVFIAEGIISNVDPRASRFDGFIAAVTAYLHATPVGSLKSAADLWATELKLPLASLYPFYRELFNKRHDGEIVVGYFLGIDHDDKLTGFQVKIIHSTDVDSFGSVIVPLSKPAFTLLGPETLVRELLAGQSTRASAVQSQIRKEANGKSAVEAQTITLKHLVQNIPVWANDSGSGGDVAQIIFEAKEKRWRWFHRPDFCPEN